MSRGGARSEREAPERRCIVTRESGPKAGLIRFVASPEGEVVPDILGKLPGRGFYVTADRAILQQAIAKKVFARGAKQSVSIPDGMLASIEAQLLRRVQDGIAMARKAGRAVTGYEKVKGWLMTGEGRVLVQASDGSGRQKTKLNTPRDGSFIGCLTGAEIGRAFGRDIAIHAALAGGRQAQRIVEDAAKLAGLRTYDGGNMATGKEHIA